MRKPVCSSHFNVRTIRNFPPIFKAVSPLQSHQNIASDVQDGNECAGIFSHEQVNYLVGLISK